MLCDLKVSYLFTGHCLGVSAKLPESCLTFIGLSSSQTLHVWLNAHGHYDQMKRVGKDGEIIAQATW